MMDFKRKVALVEAAGAAEAERERAKIDWFAACMAGSRGGKTLARNTIKRCEKTIRAAQDALTRPV